MLVDAPKGHTDAGTFFRVKALRTLDHTAFILARLMWKGGEKCDPSLWRVRVWRGSLPSIFVTEDEEEAVGTYEEQRRTAEQQHWWTKDRVELLRNDKLIRWASNDETGNWLQRSRTRFRSVSKFIMNDGRRVIGSCMVEDREQK